jgi:H+/Cl- antiporter ClcA
MPRPSLNESEWRRRTATLGGGILLALSALLFARLSDAAQALFRGHAPALGLWALLYVPAVFALVAWITRRWFAAARGSGIPQVIAAAGQPDGAEAHRLLSLPVALAKSALTIAMLLAGASLGREGPTVQIATAINVSIHRWMKVPITSGVIIAGGAAGVAAAFNTPLAGVAFAIEELAAAYEQRVALLVMMAVMIAGFISLGLNGDYLYLGRMTTAIALRTALVVIPVVGIAGGIFGGLFSRSLLFLLRARRVPVAGVHPVLLAGLCGLGLAAIGVASHGLSWGTGYAATRGLVEGLSQPWWSFPARLGATFLTAVSGTPGGIFAPSLAVGAALGNVIALAFPHAALGPIALLAMIAYFTGVVRAPLTAVIIVSEATAAHAMVVPLFAAALIADGISALICHERLYHGLSHSFTAVRASEERAPRDEGGDEAR